VSTFVREGRGGGEHRRALHRDGNRPSLPRAPHRARAARAARRGREETLKHGREQVGRPPRELHAQRRAPAHLSCPISTG